MKNPSDTRTTGLAYTALMLAVALILGYVESLIPISFGIPGIKLGLPNLAVLMTMYIMDCKRAFAVDIFRIVISSFLFGNMYSLIYSSCGGVLSFFVMLLAFRTGRLRPQGISMLGGVFHNIGQLMAAYFVVRTGGIFYYLPALLISGVVTGLVNGYVCHILRPSINGIFIHREKL